MIQHAALENHFDLLVCTCDAYEDTWMPFFTLLKEHWSGAEQLRIILTTETKDFSYPGLNILCAKTGLNWRGKSKPWGERILESLYLVKTQIVLLMLDDYFISCSVKVPLINEFADVMLKSDWASVELIPQGDKKGSPTSDPRLVEIYRDSPYRVNTQAALWRIAALKSLIRKHESPWEFEVCGTERARNKKLIFTRLVNDCEYTKGEGAITYPAGGGIWRGKWNLEKIVSLFDKHRISPDFNFRGFYEPPRNDYSITKRKGLRRFIRKDLLALISARIVRCWSEYRSFR
jgi:hypothetical protein